MFSKKNQNQKEKQAGGPIRTAVKDVPTRNRKSAHPFPKNKGGGERETRREIIAKSVGKRWLLGFSWKKETLPRF